MANILAFTSRSATQQMARIAQILARRAFMPQDMGTGGQHRATNPCHPSRRPERRDAHHASLCQQRGGTRPRPAHENECAGDDNGHRASHFAVASQIPAFGTTLGYREIDTCLGAGADWPPWFGLKPNHPVSTPAVAAQTPAGTSSERWPPQWPSTQANCTSSSAHTVLQIPGNRSLRAGSILDRAI